jgi:hypothetical protein
VFIPDGAGGHTETKLIASDGTANDALGQSVGVSGDTILVGAYLDDDNGVNSGSAYVFTPDGVGGHTETKLIASDGTTGAVFGWSVGVSGDTIVVGAHLDDDNGVNSGSAYVFIPDGAGGHTETKLIASGGTSGDQFGQSVGVSGDTIVAGAWANDEIGLDSGAAYVFNDIADTDGDGVRDDDDACPGTFLPDEPTQHLKTNRYIATADGFVSTDGTVAYTLTDTGGCSGAQLIAEAGLGAGHTRFGITRGALKTWVNSIG